MIQPFFSVFIFAIILGKVLINTTEKPTNRKQKILRFQILFVTCNRNSLLFFSPSVLFHFEVLLLFSTYIFCTRSFASMSFILAHSYYKINVYISNARQHIKAVFVHFVSIMQPPDIHSQMKRNSASVFARILRLK